MVNLAAAYSAAAWLQTSANTHLTLLCFSITVTITRHVVYQPLTNRTANPANLALQDYLPAGSASDDTDSHSTNSPVAFSMRNALRTTTAKPAAATEKTAPIRAAP